MTLNQDIPFTLSTFSDVRILTVDNHQDTGVLYAALFESDEVTVLTTESIKESLHLLNQFVPDILICEARFLGESVEPLIHRVRSIAQDRHKLIPVFVTSTFPAANLAEHLKIKIEAYQIKPIDIDQFVAEVWKLILLSKIIQPLTIHEWRTTLGMSETSCCSAGVESRSQGVKESRSQGIAGSPLLWVKQSQDDA